MIRTSVKTITKPNMIFLAFFGFSVGIGQGLRALKEIAITPRRVVIAKRLQSANGDVVGEAA